MTDEKQKYKDAYRDARKKFDEIVLRRDEIIELTLNKKGLSYSNDADIEKIVSIEMEIEDMLNYDSSIQNLFDAEDSLLEAAKQNIHANISKFPKYKHIKIEDIMAVFDSKLIYIRKRAIEIALKMPFL